MVSSSFQTENLEDISLGSVRWQSNRILLDVLGQTRHEVLAVFVQRVALLLVLVGRVYDGSFEPARLRIAGSILATLLACRALYTRPTATYAQVRRLRAVPGDLFRPQGRGCKGAHGGSWAARRAHGLAQWPSNGLAQGHYMCVFGSVAARSGGGLECCRRRGSFLPSSGRGF